MESERRKFLLSRLTWGSYVMLLQAFCLLSRRAGLANGHRPFLIRSANAVIGIRLAHGMGAAFTVASWLSRVGEGCPVETGYENSDKHKK